MASLDPEYLEPTLPAVDVLLDKRFVGLSEVDDPFDDSDYVDDAVQRKAAQHGNQQHDHALFLIAEHELVNSQAAEEDAQDSGHNFLVGAGRLPVLHHRLAIHRHGRLNRFVAWLIWLLIICLRLLRLTRNHGQHPLATGASHGTVVILRATLGTKNSHAAQASFSRKKLVRTV